MQVALPLVLLSTMIATEVLSACRSEEPTRGPWRVGGVYSIQSGDGGFGVVKVLALDPGVVSVRIYRQKYRARPTAVDPASLSLGSLHDPEGFGIGHAPVSEAGFASWKPQLLFIQSVSEDELDGYRYWKEDGGNWTSCRRTRG